MKFFILALTIILISIIFIVQVFAADINVSFLGPGGGGNSIRNYIKNLYKLALGIAGILAVGMIVFGSIYISINTGSIDKQSEGREIIFQAIWGLVLLFGSYLILYTVNPELVKLNEPQPPVNTEIIEKACPPGQTHRKNANGEEGPCEPIVGNATCAPFRSIGVLPSRPFTDTKGCDWRRFITTRKIEIDEGDDEQGKYYDENVTIPIDSVVWQWPYFLTKNTNPVGTSTARCIAYAYKTSASSTVQKIKLETDYGATPCESQPTKSESTENLGKEPCLRWPGGCVCKDCQAVPNGIDAKPPPNGCNTAASSSPKVSACQVNKTVAEKLTKLKELTDKEATNWWQLTEAWPPTVYHSSGCHYDGTCVDIANRLGCWGVSCLVEKSFCKRVEQLIQKAKDAGFQVLNEYTECGGTETTTRNASHLHLY
jgi:hypothetical protein